MKDCIAEKMLKRIGDRLYWAYRQKSYYQGVKDALDRIKATGEIFTGIRERRVNMQIQLADSIIWEMTYLLACYEERNHHQVWDESCMRWQCSEEHRENYKAGRRYQMERAK